MTDEHDEGGRTMTEAEASDLIALAALRAPPGDLADQVAALPTDTAALLALHTARLAAFDAAVGECLASPSPADLAAAVAAARRVSALRDDLAAVHRALRAGGAASPLSHGFAAGEGEARLRLLWAGWDEWLTGELEAVAAARVEAYQGGEVARYVEAMAAGVTGAEAHLAEVQRAADELRRDDVARLRPMTQHAVDFAAMLLTPEAWAVLPDDLRRRVQALADDAARLLRFDAPRPS